MQAVFQKTIVTLQARNQPGNAIVMKHGKLISEALKPVRIDIARANGIRNVPFLSHHHEGDYADTCPACESGVRGLEHGSVPKRWCGQSPFRVCMALTLNFKFPE